ncbi:MAG: helix-hairpin-helix domain-containing protein [Pseudomonadales bacterium]|jgi:competence protein ComEA|nr:helix-hairpin-helix domain-containing protein [Pseudomonadales bacterium]MCP5319686.1 helix-hairpin-helix domain-containing protein [Pseudomonadales bacterium]MCP5338366.1 helix-hairpin-helix domain-containing protein [Pseudomonadales bacterium]
MKLADVLKAAVFGLSLLTLPLAHVAAEPSRVAAPVQQAAQRVNINTADASTLASALNGVGVKKAEAIVAYRDQHGPFKSVDELINVKGIGEKMLEQLRPQVSL